MSSLRTSSRRFPSRGRGPPTGRAKPRPRTLRRLLEPKQLPAPRQKRLLLLLRRRQRSPQPKLTPDRHAIIHSHVMLRLRLLNLKSRNSWGLGLHCIVFLPV
ncbi:Copper transport protein CCH [Zea mays]|uniref:Copper transport protein CCH n=1 Tax=Zea mays TaxID=4577 RepID=B4FD04_MAIZE|nr:unknown [Zea mays]AQK71480.1 Copper transport protein CCH [Zea mays]AQK71481.1 Copper transport protein CCH [Zea mays]